MGLQDIFGGPNYAQVASDQEQARKKAITQGTADINQAFAGYTPSFYDQRAKAYTDFAMPQLARQYQGTRNQLLFNQGNRGILKGSSARQQFSDLNQTMGQDQQAIADQGRQQAQALQQQVEASKTGLINQLYQGADPSQAGAQAISTAASFRQPNAFTPIADMFGNIAQQYYLSQLINQSRTPTTIAVPSYAGGTSSSAALPGNEGY